MEITVIPTNAAASAIDLTNGLARPSSQTRPLTVEQVMNENGRHGGLSVVRDY